MKRYYDDHDNDEDDSFFDANDISDDEAIIEYIDRQNVVDVMQMELAQTELYQKLLDKAVEIAKSNWLWRFRSSEKKIDDIEKIYKKLFSMTEEDK